MKVNKSFFLLSPPPCCRELGPSSSHAHHKPFQGQIRASKIRNKRREGKEGRRGPAGPNVEARTPAAMPRHATPRHASWVKGSGKQASVPARPPILLVARMPEEYCWPNGTGPVRKSTALTRPGPLPRGPMPCPCQRSGRAWAAISARGTSMGTARLRAQHGEARPRPVWHDGGPSGPAPRAPLDRWICPLGGDLTVGGRAI